MPIIQLPREISSKIAAGEIIERPSSIVKELVENSIDAQATNISVAVRSGGIDYIRVSDNGLGIPATEVELAFMRFATSKLSEIDDLETISSLGFRGEALPSIAAVSTVSLATRPPGIDVGTLVRVIDGSTVVPAPTGAPVGTSVTVERLFSNFPARRKFLRTPSTETSRVQSVVVRYMLAFPTIKFELLSGTSRVIRSSGSGDLREAAAAVFGAETADNMLEIEPSPPAKDVVMIGGLIGTPSQDWSNRNRINLFVNGRWVQDRTLCYAVEEAYRGFLKERKFPLAVLNLVIPPKLVDVNVHPAKTEVRFQDPGLVFAELQKAIRRTLVSDSPVPEIKARFLSDHTVYEGSTSGTQSLGKTFHGRPLSLLEDDLGGISESTRGSMVPRDALPIMRVLGQVQTTYIVAEGPNGLYLIDQHAAHERVLFERVCYSSKLSNQQSQILLEAETVELEPRQVELVTFNLDMLQQMGFQIEMFGASRYLLRSVPVLMVGGDYGRAFVEFLDLMDEGGGFESWNERAAYSIACHSAIRAGKKMTEKEMTELARQLEKCNQPHTCPHGRPTMIHLSKERLEREFGRS